MGSVVKAHMRELRTEQWRRRAALARARRASCRCRNHDGTSCGDATSVTARAIDQSDECLAARKAAQIFDHRECCRPGLRHARDVRRDTHPGMRPQRIVAWQRLRIRDVEHGFGQMSAVERLQQVRRDELCAASDVHETRAAAAASRTATHSIRPAWHRSTATGRRARRCVRAAFELIVAGVAAYAGNIVAGAAPSRTIEVEGDEFREHRLGQRSQSEHAYAALPRGSHR